MAVQTLKILQHNVLHWWTRRNELYNTYRAVDPDIILINSHGQRLTTPIKIYNYKVYYNNPTDSNNDGVAIAIRNNIPHQLHDDLDEAYLAVTITTTLGPIYIATGYQPPRRPAIPLINLRRIFRRQCPTYFIGDLNARHKNFGQRDNNTAGNMLNDFINNGTIIRPDPEFQTYVTPRASSTPDIVLKNQRCFHHTRCYPGPLTSSDHIPTIYEISSSPTLLPSLPKYQYNKANWDNFKESLHHHPLINLENQPSETINTATEAWFTQVTSAMNEAIPKSTGTITPHPLVTPDIQSLQDSYMQLLQQADTRNWTPHHRRLLKALQMNLQNKYRTIRQQQWEEKILEVDASHKEPTKFWKSVKKLLGTTTITTPYLLDPDGNKIYKEKDQERLFREYYQKLYTIGPEEERQYCQETDRAVKEFLHTNADRTSPYQTVNTSRLDPRNSLISPITYTDFKSTLQSFKSNKAPGESKINKLIMSNLPENMIINLLHIYNASLSCGIFPKKFKKAILKLIPKAEKNIKIVENYRPISLLELAGKIYEKIINNRLRLFLEAGGRYHPNQHSYRRGRGTHTALATIYETISKSQDHREQCTLVLRDVSKAYDKIWHEGLIFKILHLELPRCLTALLCNFLKDRHAAIQLNTFTGPDFFLQCGVPQGSVLSPTLYNIYTSDTPPGQHGTNIIYADDVTQIITYPGKSKNIMKLYTTREIEKLNEYERRWKIKTNQQKFKLLHISKHNPPEINIEGRNINYTQEATVLGLKINTRGFNPHVSTRIRLAQQAFKKIKRFSRMRPRIKKHLTKAMVFPHLMFSPTPLYACSNHNKLKMQRIINKSLRWINGDRPPYNTTIKQLHERLEIIPLNIQIYRQNYNLWTRMRENFPELYEKFTTDRDRVHKWWPTSLITEDTGPPEPLYIHERRPRNMPNSDTESD